MSERFAAGAAAVAATPEIAVGREAGALTKDHKKVIFASSLGTVFEWYDFYLYGSLAAIISKQFFSGVNETAAFIFALMAFAAGFAVRPFGALVFGRLGDLVGRKYTFLITILLMGASTFVVGLLPSYAAIGIAAPIILIVLRLMQGLALGGEYGGAATYVAEHAPQGKRGLYTSWIQTTATLGLFLSLVVILGVRTVVGEEAFADWGWRLPFLLSIVLLAVSVWIRLSLNESPVFQRMKEEGSQSKAPLTESFGQWKNLKLVILALLGLTAGQAVVWYTGQFYALFFLTQTLKVDAFTANILIALSLVIGTPFFILFGALSDRIGRKQIILGGCLLAAVTYFPIFNLLTHYANPALEQAQKNAPVTVVADPKDCSFQFNPVGTAKFTSSCDVAKSFLARNAVNYSNEAAPAGAVAGAGHDRGALGERMRDVGTGADPGASFRACGGRASGAPVAGPVRGSAAWRGRVASLGAGRESERVCADGHDAGRYGPAGRYPRGHGPAAPGAAASGGGRYVDSVGYRGRARGRAWSCGRSGSGGDRSSGRVPLGGYRRC
jgi:MFS family permease